MVGYAFAAEQPSRVTKFVLLDAPLPGDRARGRRSSRARCCGTSASEGLTWNDWSKGRERIYLDRFWNEFSADPEELRRGHRQHYAKLYALPGAMHSGFEQFKAFDQDAIDNKAFLAKGPLPMPVLAIGGEKSFGPTMAVVMRAAATNVQEAVIPHSGHWLMEENPSRRDLGHRANSSSDPRIRTRKSAKSAGAAGSGGLSARSLRAPPAASCSRNSTGATRASIAAPGCRASREVIPGTGLGSSCQPGGEHATSTPDRCPPFRRPNSPLL